MKSETKPNPAEDDLADGAFDVPGAVEFSSQTRTALYEAMASGDLPYYTRGKHRLISRRALVAWMAKTFQPAQG